MRLIIVHYHLRPGGIRRIIELATPHLLRQLKRVERVVLAVGEANDDRWNRAFEKALGKVPVEFFVEPSFGYVSEQKICGEPLARKVRAGLDRLLGAGASEETVVWAHNLGIARNLLLTRELLATCEARAVRVIAHHHDWWFDNRWLRWPEIWECGFRSMAAAARAVFPGAKQVRHFTINHADARIVERHLGKRVSWLPNLTDRGELPSASRVNGAKRWLERAVGEKGAPVWLVPCRLLRRKNIAEALLIARLARPEAWLVTTGGTSSPDEEPYSRKLAEACTRQKWRMKLSVLAGEAGAPTVAELMAPSECVLLTSIQEGFGLPFIEAAAANRPLIARELPNIAPDLERFGFEFPQYYKELRVPMELFDWLGEKKRQHRLFKEWQKNLPQSCRRLADEPPFLQAVERGSPVRFSRLTLTAQLEVLGQPSEALWQACGRLNPFLAEWRKRAASGRLRSSRWPAQAGDWLSGPAYARRWAEGAASEPRKVPSAADAASAQRDFIEWKLGSEYLYPLLWSKET